MSRVTSKVTRILRTDQSTYSLLTTSLGSCKHYTVSTHRLLSSSFLGLPYRILNKNHKKELLRSLWVCIWTEPVYGFRQSFSFLIRGLWEKDSYRLDVKSSQTEAAFWGSGEGFSSERQVHEGNVRPADMGLDRLFVSHDCVHVAL